MPIDPANAAVAPLEASTQIGGSVHAVGYDAHGRKWMVGRKLPARQREHLLHLLRKQLAIERPERA